MKNIIVITLLSFLFFACQGDGEQKVNTSMTKTSATHDDHAGHDHANESPTHHTASAMAPLLGRWLFFSAIKDPEKYAGRYMDFRANGSFTSGKDGIQTNSGNWTIDEETKLLDIDFADNSKEKDEQWKAQNQSPNVIILLGNTPKNPGGNQIKLERIPR